jgi:Zn finger protein HypA/HybF involved in hydrogenase expression
MIVRCGRCQSGFEVPGPGRHTCPACGTPNDVRGGQGAPPGDQQRPVVPEPQPPTPRVSCTECGFSFIVGAVEEAPCPNCGTMVAVGDHSGDGL